MTDETSRFAAILARSVGRLDWLNVYEECTDYEWSSHLALYSVEPWGERRADIRAAYHTANLICSQSAKTIDDQDFAKMRHNLSTYLKCDEEPERKITPEQTARLVANSFERIGS